MFSLLFRRDRFLTMTVLSAGIILVISAVLFIHPRSARAADDSIFPGPVMFVVSADVDENGFANIGDVVSALVTLNNADGGCVAAGTTVIADMTAYGGTDSELLTCTADNGGEGDTFQLDFIVQNAGENGIDVVADDAASEVTLTANDNDEDPESGDGLVSGNTSALGADQGATNGVDTIAPSFTGLFPVQALLQNEGATDSVTNLWYYYPGQSLVFMANVQDADIESARACVWLLTTDGSSNCTPPDFQGDSEDGDGNTIYINFDTYEGGGPDFIFDTALGSLSSVPVTPTGYPMSVWLQDDAGNSAVSSSENEMLTAVFGINPPDLVPALGYGGSTDWSTINDFTNVTNLTFEAQECDECGEFPTEVGSMVLDGPINLTDPTTMAALQNLGDNMSIDGDAIRLNSALDALAAMNTSATLGMLINSEFQPGLTIKDNDGAILGYISNIAGGEDEYVVGGDTITNVTWDGEAQWFSFDTSGFSEFDSDYTAPTFTTAPLDGGSATRGRAIELMFDEPVDPESLLMTDSNLESTESYVYTWNGDDTQVTISHDGWSTDDVALTAVVDDKTGNESDVAEWTFRVHSSSTGGGGGGLPSPAATLTLSAPNGGELFEQGSTHSILWSSTQLSGATINLALSSDGGLTFPTTIATAQANNGSYTWMVPSVTGSSYRMKVEAVSGGSVVLDDLSDTNFSIGPAGSIPPVTPPTEHEINDVSSGPSFNPSVAQAASPDISDDLGLIPATEPVHCTAGSLLKLADDRNPATFADSSVYYCGIDGKRYVFPNANFYFTWYPNFSGVLIVSPEVMASIPFGGVVLVRPGVKMVKFESDPKVYAVAPGGLLRWITTEAVATRLYGPTWNTMVFDVSISFRSFFHFGPDITE